jgi:hypothetical protein
MQLKEVRTKNGFYPNLCTTHISAIISFEAENHSFTLMMIGGVLLEDIKRGRMFLLVH